MAEVQVNDRSKGSKKNGRIGIKVDMTPMVDLGFLLITFFLFSTNFSKPNVMDLGLPAKGPHGPTDIDYRNSITFILGKDSKVYYYQDERKNLNDNSLKEVSFDRAQVAKTIELAKANAPKKENFTVIIKPDDDSQYKTLVDMLDELAITRSERYGISEMNDKEKDLYQKKVL
ncbi:biopolymer transport protein ExbD [Epilithonimonas hungarica]|uniref:ExbD/TolR family protein n=1 Tax=Epilithonimonas hungarica TaxID=454006 RepID=UPI0027872EF9|nr:biopolymer transporter ExbD [Epilithonimonas hungarica]MDP9954663.1 biopolymer transport protein ExbD [Epilithonimonas hungarica]